jgi:hypothetical protein
MPSLRGRFLSISQMAEVLFAEVPQKRLAGKEFLPVRARRIQKRMG